MTPEQIEGRDVDARTDIFAFGVVLYEVICGRRPFTGDSRASLMAAIVAQEPLSLSALQPQTPASLERLIVRCLAKDPDQRWQTARDLAAELRWIAEAGSGTTAGIVATTRRSRRAGVLSGLAGVVVTAAVLAATAWAIWPRPTVAEYRPLTYRRGRVTSARFTPDGQNFVYSASWEGQPYEIFLGRFESPDARDLQLRDARLLSISRAGDMAVLFGPQNIQRSFGIRTLARIPMAGGARRPLLTGVVDADWIPGTDALAVIRDPGGNQPWVVEFPVGTPVHEARRQAWSLRVSPDGRRLAFFEGPQVFDSEPKSMITVIEKSGNKSTLTGNLAGYGLAWTPSGTEIWFTATRPQNGEYAPHLKAVSLSGVERAVHYAPDWIVLHDISSNGRVLLSRNTIRINMVCKPPGEQRERDLSWLVASVVRSLSPDGSTVIFTDPLGRTPSGTPMLFRRSMDDSPAVPIGEGVGGALSPDGNWVLAAARQNLVLLPTGAGEMITLPKGPITTVGGGSWLGDSKHIVFNGEPGTDKRRGYIQEIPSGLPRPITPEGVGLAGTAAIRDDNVVLGRAGDAWKFFPIHGGAGQRVDGLLDADVPLQWSRDGRYLYAVVDRGGELPPPATPVFRVDVTTGARMLWKTLAPSDTVGVEGTPRVAITPDAQSYCYSYLRRLGDLFVVDGLK